MGSPNLKTAKDAMDCYFLVISFLISSSLGYRPQYPRRQSAGAHYDHFKLLRMDTVGLRDTGSLYEFLSPRADFWTQPVQNGTVDFMISPQEYGTVIRYFHQQRIPFEVLMDDVQNGINAQMHDVQQTISDLNDNVDERSGSSD